MANGKMVTCSQPFTPRRYTRTKGKVFALDCALNAIDDPQSGLRREDEETKKTRDESYGRTKVERCWIRQEWRQPSV